MSRAAINPFIVIDCAAMNTVRNKNNCGWVLVGFCGKKNYAVVVSVTWIWCYSVLVVWDLTLFILCVANLLKCSKPFWA